jgi:hypothetical protein
MGMNGGTPIRDDCQNPTANQDPGFKSLEGAGRVDALDLDGIDSREDSGNEHCGHDDFVGLAGEAGIDFQLWRAVGCVRGFQEGEIAAGVITASVKDGSMTLLIEVRGVDDPQNDDHVEVRIFGSTDSPPVGADGNVLPWGTLSTHADLQYHSTSASGRIVDGVLEAGPLDIRWRFNIQIVNADMTLRQAQIRLVLHPDGTASGGLYGYSPIDDLYEIFGRQAGQAGAAALSYTCTGLYAALAREADGDFDATTGSCTSLSVAYRFEAMPAFVVQ